VSRYRKQAKAESWAADAALYCTKVLEWQRSANELPATIKLRDKGARTAFFAAEAARAHLASQREVLTRKAVRLGIDSLGLPEPVWPDSPVGPSPLI
jgi:hypothetical protein